MPRAATLGELIGAGPAMDAVRRFVERAARVDAPVLLLGETGTGKTLLARVLHDAGARGSGPFVALNCAALPDSLVESELFGHERGAFTGAHEERVGLIEAAHRGTLLLDEVGDLPLAQQAKLLTVLEDGEVRRVGARRSARVDTRVVSATSCELEGRMRTGLFRPDLFHRLALLSIRLPALRERPHDIARLAEHFLRSAAARHRTSVPSLDERTLRALGAYGWPGNVRELAHTVEAALILGGENGFGAALEGLIGERSSVECADGDGNPGSPRPTPGTRYSFYGTGDEERERIRDALARCRGNRTRAARDLGMSRNTLRDRIARYGL